MNDVIFVIAAVTAVFRSVVLVGGVALAIIATADWAVRTRRINPFNGVARFMRARVDPRLAGVERQVIRVGGHPSATPWWALVVYVVVAALLLAALDMIVGMLREALLASTMGATGVLLLGLRWTFAFLRVALLIRVFGSWFPRVAASRWLRWSYGATEWMLRPLRRVIPTLGMVDITPIVAYFALQLVEGLLTRLLFPGMG